MSRMPRARRIRAVALVAALATAPLALAACAASTPGATPSAAAPAGLAVAIQQGRLDVVGHRLVVRFENTGDDPVTIDRFDRRDADASRPRLVRTKPFELTAGDAIAIRLDLPASRCDAEPARPVLVRSTRRTAAGPSEAASSLADDPFDTVARVNDADCLAESVAAVAAIVDARAPALDRGGRRPACVHRRRW